MSSSTKTIGIVFFIVLFLLLTLTVLYFWRTGVFLPDSSGIRSEDPSVSIQIKDSRKFKNFLAEMCNCGGNGYTVYAANEPGVTQKANSIEIVITQKSQSGIVSGGSSQNGPAEILYTYSTSFDEKNKKANIYLSFPENKDAENVNNAIVVTVYRLFKGQPYSAYDEKVASYNSLDKLGLEYVKN